MKSIFDKLNLRPQERRLVVVVGIVIFVVINVVFVYPIFGDYGKTMQRMKDARKDLTRYQDEIKRKGVYDDQLRKLESSGSFVGEEERASQLMTEVRTQSQLTGVDVRNWNPSPRGSAGKSNAFFEEQTLAITVANTGEKELVDFLYNLSSGTSLIRVRTMALGPEPNHYKLQGNLTLIESFQKKSKAARPSATSTPAPPPTKPAVSPSPTPGPAPGSTPTPAKTNGPPPARNPKAALEPDSSKKTPGASKK